MEQPTFARATAAAPLSPSRASVAPPGAAATARLRWVLLALSTSSSSALFSLALQSEALTGHTQGAIPRAKGVCACALSLACWSACQAMAPLVARLTSRVGWRPVSAASAMLTFAGMVQVAWAVHKRSAWHMFAGWGVGVGVGCSVHQVATDLHYRRSLSKPGRSGGAHRSSFEALPFLWALLSLAFQHWCATSLGLGVPAAMCAQAGASLALAILAAFAVADEAPGCDAPTLEELLYCKLASLGRAGLGKCCERRRCAEEPSSSEGDVESPTAKAKAELYERLDKAPPPLWGRREGLALGYGSSCGNTLLRLQAWARAYFALTAGVRRRINPLGALAASRRVARHLCRSDLWIVCAVHVLMLTPLLATLVLMPHTAHVLFSSPLGVVSVAWPPTMLMVVGLLTYGGCHLATLSLCSHLPLRSVYSMVCVLAGTTLVAMPIWEEESTYGVFVASQCLILALLGTTHFLMPLFVRQHLASDLAACHACVGAIRLITGATTFLAALWGLFALDAPMSYDKGPDPLVVETRSNVFFACMGLMQAAAATGLHAAGRKARAGGRTKH